MKENKSAKIELLFSILCWITIITQFIVMIDNRVTSITETTIRFFTFFTILTNILVAIVFTAVLIKPKRKFSFFLNPINQSAIAVYIFVVGFVYNLILRFLWQPQGVQRIVDEMLHTIIPIYYILYWYFKSNTKSILWKNFINWLIYPIVYLVVIMIRGSFSNYYPYPFVNVTSLGIDKVFINIILLTLFFGGVAIAFIGIAKWKNKRIS
ncbi:Pr6Pr family membrane protein [Flavobacterium sp.]|uniref:Pr6Pr family membrane protein n=1 Tax=Flavobacterium sp. TaxID=239 RepID=UPI002618F1E5|nr:Pr6Pr family membrane protein [Flavobacterium sp.]